MSAQRPAWQASEHIVAQAAGGRLQVSRTAADVIRCCCHAKPRSRRRGLVVGQVSATLVGSLAERSPGMTLFRRHHLRQRRPAKASCSCNPHHH
jgi:hypothetical protein